MERLTWKQIYELWEADNLLSYFDINDPLDCEIVKVDCKPGFYVYQYDWAAKKSMQELRNDPDFDLSSIERINKGSAHTIKMLLTAQDEEELAAIWIAATAKELGDCRLGVGIAKYVHAIYQEAICFLQTRYRVWHHAMKEVIPSIFIPSSLLDSMVCKDASAVVGLIRLNTLLLKSEMGVVIYSSLPENEVPDKEKNVRN